MSLFDHVKKDLNIARKVKNVFWRDTLVLLIDDLQKAEKSKGSPLDDEETVTVLKKAYKRRDESILGARQAGRLDIVESEEKEQLVIAQYLPAEYHEEDVREHIEAIIEDEGITSKKEMGKVMKRLMPIIANRFDGKTAKALVEGYLE